MALNITRATLLTPLPDTLLLLTLLTIGGITGWSLRRYFMDNIAIVREKQESTDEELVRAVKVLLEEQEQRRVRWPWKRKKRD